MGGDVAKTLGILGGMAALTAGSIVTAGALAPAAAAAGAGAAGAGLTASQIGTALGGVATGMGGINTMAQALTPPPSITGAPDTSLQNLALSQVNDDTNRPPAPSPQLLPYLTGNY